jgi:hypothetical protein
MFAYRLPLDDTSALFIIVHGLSQQKSVFRGIHVDGVFAEPQAAHHGRTCRYLE